MVVAYRINDETVRIVVKGAPEYIVPMCNFELDGNNDSNEITNEDREEYLEQISDVIANDTYDCLKPITYAYKDMPVYEFEELKHGHSNFEEEDSRYILESNLILAASFWLADPIRPEVTEVVVSLHNAKINTRILSGDHKQTVLSAAHKIGIIDSVDFANAMSGEEFRAIMTPLLKQTMTGENGCMSYEFVTEEAKKQFRNEIKKKFMLLYRANPSDKHMFAAAMKKSGTCCAVTGDGINDALALTEANVGFSMGKSGCAVAKDHADIIILDDNFASVKNAAKWGRNIFDNARKFI